MTINWNTDNIPDLTGKVIIVTGGNSGIGYIAVKELAKKGGDVILACRNKEKGDSAVSILLKENPHAKIEALQLDLADLNSVAGFSDKIKKKFTRLDVLLNNAGIMMPPYGLTKDGFEIQMGTNHLGHFALTGHLLNLIIKTPHSRVVNISSNAHKYGKMNFDNFLFEKGKGYTPLKAYANSKLANLLFTYELQRRFNKAQKKSLALAAHPGIANTNLGRYIEKKFLVKLLMPLWHKMSQSPEMGALPGIRAATDPGVQPAEYYGPDGKMESKGYPIVVSSIKASHTIENAIRLWTLSEKITKVKYQFIP